MQSLLAAHDLSKCQNHHIIKTVDVRVSMLTIRTEPEVTNLQSVRPLATHLVVVNERQPRRPYELTRCDFDHAEVGRVSQIASLSA